MILFAKLLKLISGLLYVFSLHIIEGILLLFNTFETILWLIVY